MKPELEEITVRSDFLTYYSLAYVASSFVSGSPESSKQHICMHCTSPISQSEEQTGTEKQNVNKPSESDHLKQLLP